MNSFRRLFQLCYNAAFTEMGRQNLVYRFRNWKLLKFTPFLAGEIVPFHLKSGRRFVVHPNDRLSMSIYLEREYEPLETALAEAILRPGDVAIDAGANVGYFSALFGTLVGEQGAVLAFEPGPQTFRKLQESLRLLDMKNVTPINAAVGAMPGVCGFVRSRSGADAQQSVSTWSGQTGEQELIEVQMKTMDSLLGEHSAALARLALIKCDVEGFEVHAFRGAQTLLTSTNPPLVLFEVNRQALLANRSRVDELLALFGEYRLLYTPLDGGDNILWEYTGDAAALPDLTNFLALPRRGSLSSRFDPATSRGRWRYKSAA